jgi:hypothetical protein
MVKEAKMPYKDPAKAKQSGNLATKKYMQEWRKANPELNKERKRLDYLKHKEKVKLQQAEYRAKHREEILERMKKYNKNNRNKINETLRTRERTDLNYKLLCTLRARIRRALIGFNKKSTTSALLGCSICECRQYLESKFLPGMSWDNYGLYGWHIDHIRPCASFDLTDPEQQKQCFHYTNLQPLWAYDNLQKGDTWDGYNPNSPAP